jgi:hypothetical protein
MTRSRILVGSILLSLTSAVGAQQSLCNPCVDPPLNRPLTAPGGLQLQRNYGNPNPTTIVTSEDLRRIGIVSVADMIEQLPNNIQSVVPEDVASDEADTDVGSVIELQRRLGDVPQDAQTPSDSSENSESQTNGASDKTLSE